MVDPERAYPRHTQRHFCGEQLQYINTRLFNVFGTSVHSPTKRISSTTWARVFRTLFLLLRTKNTRGVGAKNTVLIMRRTGSVVNAGERANTEIAQPSLTRSLWLCKRMRRPIISVGRLASEQMASTRRRHVWKSSMWWQITHDLCQHSRKCLMTDVVTHRRHGFLSANITVTEKEQRYFF